MGKLARRAFLFGFDEVTGKLAEASKRRRKARNNDKQAPSATYGFLAPQKAPEWHEPMKPAPFEEVEARREARRNRPPAKVPPRFPRRSRGPAVGKNR